MVHEIGGGDCSAWRVDADDDCLYSSVGGGFVELFGEEAHGVLAGAYEALSASVCEEAVDINDGDFVANEEACVFADGCFGETLLAGDEFDAERRRAAAGELITYTLTLTNSGGVTATVTNVSHVAANAYDVTVSGGDLLSFDNFFLGLRMPMA